MSTNNPELSEGLFEVWADSQDNSYAIVSKNTIPRTLWLYDYETIQEIEEYVEKDLEEGNVPPHMYPTASLEVANLNTFEEAKNVLKAFALVGG